MFIMFGFCFFYLKNFYRVVVNFECFKLEVRYFLEVMGLLFRVFKFVNVLELFVEWINMVFYKFIRLFFY